jgi:hypothetical protein
MADDNIVRLAGMNDASPPAVTEDSAALEFADRYRNELRYDHEIGRWYRWNGKFWGRENTKLAFEWARQLARELAGTIPSRQLSKTTFAADGATDRQLMAMFDWSTSSQANVYTAAANRKRLAAEGSRLLSGTFGPPKGEVAHQDKKA